MAKTIHSIYSMSPFGHNDCLMLVNADDHTDAVNRAVNETTILEMFCEENLIAEDLELTAPTETYMKIFSDDIAYND